MAGSHQLCAGQIAGVEAVKSSFLREDTEAVLLIDTSNAFNSLNYSRTSQYPSALSIFCTYFNQHLYRSAATLYIGGDTLLSEEGTTQRDPLAMPMYALATLPLSERLPSAVTQVWYADDACACGSIAQLHQWWECLSEIGPGYGYFVNAKKTWLVTKSSFGAAAAAQFAGTGVNVTVEGRPYLGAAIGTQEYIRKFMGDKIREWSAEVLLLAKIGESQPHAAYSALTHAWFVQPVALCISYHA